MKFYLYLSLFCAFSLGMTVQLGLNQKNVATLKVPYVFREYHQTIKSSFKRTEYANLVMSFLFGSRMGISPQTIKAFSENNLGFLLSPSGVHLGGFFLLIGFFLKRLRSKKLQKIIKITLLLSSFMLPQFYAVKRLAMLRLAFMLKNAQKWKLSSEVILIFIFFLAFCSGQYFNSPTGFLLSLLYIGTFFSFSDQPRVKLIIALCANQALLSMFLGTKISIFSVVFGLVGVLLFSFLFLLVLIFFLSYWLISINWLEPIINFYVQLLKFSAFSIQGTFTSSSIFFLLSLWSLLFIRNKKIMRILFGISMLLHTNTAMTPAIFSS